MQNPSSSNFFSFAHRVQLPGIILASILGLAIAPLVATSPKIGVAAVGGLFIYAAMMQRAEVPFLLLVVSLAIPVQKTIAGIPINMTDAVLVAWGLAWPFLMVRKYSPTGGADHFEIPKLVWFLLPLTLAGLLSLIGAENTSTTLKQTIRLIEWFIVLPLLLLSVPLHRSFWNMTTVALLLTPCFFALDGIVEVLNNGNSISHMLGIPVPIPSEELSEIRHTFDISGRAGSTFGGAQGLAMYLTMMMSMITAVVLLPPRPIFRLLALGALALCMAGMFFAKSRGGYIGFIGMLAITIFLMYPKASFKIALIGGITLAIGITGFLLLSGWNGDISTLVPGRAESILDRLIIWQRALSIFKEHPINGVGLGGFRDAVYNSGGIRLNVPLGYESLHCHNTYLEILTGTGLLGFAGYIFFLVLTGLYLYRAWQNRTGAPSDCFILGGLSSLAAYMIFGMVDMLLLQNMHLVLVTLLTLGFWASRVSATDTDSPRISPDNTMHTP